MSLTKALLNHPGISTDLIATGLNCFGWTILGLVIAHTPSDKQKEKLQILEALLQHGEDPLYSFPYDVESSCAISVGIDELDIDSLQILCKPPFKWSKVKREQHQKINESLENQFDYIEYMSSFHEDESSINSQTLYDWLQALVKLEMPHSRYPALEKRLKFYPEILIEHEQTKLNETIPNAKQDKIKIYKRL